MDLSWRSIGRIALSALVLGAALSPLDRAHAAGETSAASPELRIRALALGLDQVLGDDAGHRFDRGRVRDVAIANDGAVWLLVGRRLIEVGRPGSLAPRSDRWQEYLRRLEPTSDGELWAVEDGGVVVRLDDQALVDGSAGRRSASGSLSALPDGSLWRVLRGADGAPMLAASTGDGVWQLQDATGLESLLVPGAARFTFGRTADGRTWFGADHGARGGGLAVHAGDGWTLLGEQAPERALRVRALEPDHDGSLWVLGSVGAPGPSTRHVLVRITGDRVETLDDAAGMPGSRMHAWTGWSPLQPGALAIDPRGKIWFSIDDVGLWTYDSSGFRRITRPELRAGALDLETAPDGSIWAVSRRGALFRLADPVAPQAPSVEPVQYDALAITQ